MGLPGGEFLMGTDDELGFPADGEGPIRRITLKPFYIDETSVTNAQFTRFVKSTRYQIEAEQFGWSFVFHLFLTKRARREATHAVTEVPWWLRVNGATWRHPEGPGSGVKDRMDHPTVHISWNDAMSYSEWAGKRLATEAEWEFSARGGLEQRRYAWGDELTPGASTAATSGRATSPTVIPAKMAIRALPQHDHTSPTTTGCITSPAMSGNGPQIGSAPTIMSMPARQPAGPGARRFTNDSRRIIPLPRIVLQSLPGRCTQFEHAR